MLLPDRMEQRRVMAGHLGCPICGWSAAWTNGVPDFGESWRGAGSPPFDAAAAHAMLGLDGPGGWVALGGNAGSLGPELALLLPGVSFVAVNPPLDVQSTNSLSVLLSGAWPLKTHSMRGVILGSDATMWRDAAMQSALPRLRTVGVGDAPSGAGVQLLGNADGVWVGTKR